MEPIDGGKPSAGTFLIMSAVYFGLYFGLKYGVFGGQLPWYLNLILIVACVSVVIYLRNRTTK